MKKFIAGLVIGLLLSSSIVFGASRIKSAEYNTNIVIFNGKELVLDKPLISVVGEDSDAVSNYMPVRAVLEAMGYSVSWDGMQNAITIKDKPASMNINTDKASSAQIPDGYVFLRDLGIKYGLVLHAGTPRALSKEDIHIVNVDDLKHVVLDNQTYVDEAEFLEHYKSAGF